MIVRKNLKISIILRGAWKILALWFLLSGCLYLAYFHFQIKALALPFGPVAVMGTALSIFLGFRNSSSYDRWWDARTMWGGIVNQSRIFSSQVLSFSTHGKKTEMSPHQHLHKEMIYRHLAWINSLRLQLRKQTDTEFWEKQVRVFLSESDWEKIKMATNRCTQLLFIQANVLAEATSEGVFDDYRHMQIDQTIKEFYNLQGQCERIKNTPLPRQYDYFNRAFMHIFVFLLPFSLLETFKHAALPVLLIPFILLIGFVFYIIEGVGRRIEDPFENKITDTPLSALCITIEIDLKEMLGDLSIPKKAEPVDGFLF